MLLYENLVYYLIVGDNFNFTMLENTDTRIGSSQIDTNTRCFLGHFYL